MCVWVYVCGGGTFASWGYFPPEMEVGDGGGGPKIRYDRAYKIPKIATPMAPYINSTSDIAISLSLCLFVSFVTIPKKEEGRRKKKKKERRTRKNHTIRQKRKKGMIVSHK
jgi:hypothetical protein